MLGDGDEVGEGLQGMHGGGLHGHDGLAAVLHELLHDGLGIVVVAVGEACEGADGDDVAVAAHHRDGLQEMLALIAVHDDTALSLEFPCTGIDIEYDDIHAEVHGSLLCGEARAQGVIEENHQQCFVLAQLLIGEAVGFHLFGFFQSGLQGAEVLYVEECFHKLGIRSSGTAAAHRTTCVMYYIKREDNERTESKGGRVGNGKSEGRDARDKGQALRAHLSVAVDKPLVGGHLFQCHRAAGPQLLRADANLGTKAKLRTVGETRGCIDIDAGGINGLLEMQGGSLVVGDDALAVPTTVSVDMLKRLINGVDGLDAHLHTQPLVFPLVIIGNRNEQVGGIVSLQCCVGTRIGMELHLLIGQRLDQLRQIAQP